MNLKLKAAEEAVKLIKDQTIIGIGAGSTIAHMVDILSQRIMAGLTIKLVTSSYSTRMLCLQKSLPLIATSDIDKVDFYFDSCDQLDYELNALKSGGGIHTQEKLLASMADEFIILGDETKLVSQLTTTYPVVLEVMPDAFLFVKRKIQELFNDIRFEQRMSNNKDGAVITENGNYLINLWLQQFPEAVLFNQQLKMIPGIVETSLFTSIASKAIIALPDDIKLLSSSRLH